MRSENFKWFLLIAFAAIVLRVYAIDRLPPGLFGDEAVEGLDALDVLAGNFQVWFHAHLGREPLFVYLVALSYAFFGVTPLATRLPALIAGLATIPATFFFSREWARSAVQNENRATRLALFTTALLTISFWHIQMNRNAHRDILLPLVQAVGYFFLWRGLRTRDWKGYAAAGAVLGLAIYTYSPGRFVGVFIAIFFAIEFLIAQIGRSRPSFEWRGIFTAACCAALVMLPLGIYFAQNSAQFVRRFDSASIFNAPQPLAAFAASVSGNLAQFVVPGAGYDSKHYNLPGKPVFDLFLTPWLFAGVAIALARLKNSAYRFSILWFVVMMTPAFLTADMIPKGVRGLGTLPGVLVFIAVAMDALLEHVPSVTLSSSPVSLRANDVSEAIALRINPAKGLLASTNIKFLCFAQNDKQTIVRALVALTFIGSAIWTTYDYFITWANLPELPIAFDSDYAEAGEFVNHRLPPDQPIYVSAEVYRHPTFMLLGKRVPTSQYFDRSTRIKEFDATSALVSGDANSIAVFVGDQSPPEDWYRRLAPQNAQIATGTFFAAYRLRDFAPPQRTLSESFNPFLRLVGYSQYLDEPRGIALFWQIAVLPEDREEMLSKVILMDARGQTLAQSEHRLGYSPMEWSLSETVVEWFEFDVPDNASSDSNQFVIQLSRGNANWKSLNFLLE